MTISLEKIKDGLKWKNLRKICWQFLLKRGKWLLFLLLFGVFMYGGYLWYSLIYRAQWSESRKQEYMATKDKGTVFDSKRFNDAVTEWQTRRGNYNSASAGDIQDIFRIKK